jgi:hypothetical protein
LIKKSIEQRFAGGVRYDDDRMEFTHADVEKKLDHARDLLILALVRGTRIPTQMGRCRSSWIAALCPRVRELKAATATHISQRHV